MAISMSTAALVVLQHRGTRDGSSTFRATFFENLLLATWTLLVPNSDHARATACVPPLRTAMGNLLCPPTRPSRDPDWERRRQRAAASGRDDRTKSLNPTLLPSEINALPLERFHTPTEMRAWPVKRLKDEVKQARRNSPADRSVLSGPMPLEKEELVAALRFARGGETGETCNICFDQYDVGDTYRVLTCGHRFHIECVDRWLRSTSLRCPLCNHDTREKWISAGK